MGSAFLLSGLAPTVQAEENDAKPETKSADGSAVNGTNAPTVETEHLIIESQPKESEPKSESTPIDNPKTDVESASMNETKPLNSESSQPKEEPAASVNSTEGANSAAPGTTEAKPTEEKLGEQPTPSKRSVSIVYKVRYIDRQSGKVVHEVTKTKTVETTEAKAKASVTEIGAELAMDSQLENYYVPDGNPTTFTKEIVEGADNVFVYEVEGFGEAETPKERTVALKYTVEYVDKKSGLVLASEEKEEKVSTTETVAKKEVTIQPSLETNEKLKDWVLSDGAPASQKLTLTEGTVGKVTFKLQSSEGGKVRNKRTVENRTENVYLTLENYTKSDNHDILSIDGENMTLNGRTLPTYTFKYKVGVTNRSNPEDKDWSDVEMTEGAQKLGFTLDKENGWLTATVTPSKEIEGTHAVGIRLKSNPNVKVVATVEITLPHRPPHHGFELVSDSSGKTLPYYYSDESTEVQNGGDLSSNYRVGYSPIDWFPSNDKDAYSRTSNDDIVIDNISMPTTPFGYLMNRTGATVEDVTEDTKRYYAMIPIYAPLDVSTNYPNNDKRGLTIKKFEFISGSEGVGITLMDLTKDKAPDKGFYSNTKDFQTMPEYDFETGRNKNRWEGNDFLNTPYYLRFTNLPKTAGEYSVKFKITDSLDLEKTFTLNFRTYENSITSYDRYRRFALTNADALFEPNTEYVNKSTGKVVVPISDKEQILGKLSLNKANAYLVGKKFPTGLELRKIDGKVDEDGNPTEAYVVKPEKKKIAIGDNYPFSVIAKDGHFQTGAVRTFNFDVVDSIRTIADQEWEEGSAPTPISVSMENGSRITGIRVETSGGYAYFEGNPTNSNIAIYGLKQTPSQQKARVYVTYTDGNGKEHETFTDFNYVIRHNTVDDLAINVTPSNQTIFEGENWKEMVITTTPSEGVTIKLGSKLPKGTRFVGNKIVGKGYYAGTYDIPVFAIKGDVVKSTVVHLVVQPKAFVVPPEKAEVEALSNDIKAVTTDENGEVIKTPVSSFGMQNAPDDATISYSASYNNSGLTISSDGSRITGIPTTVGEHSFDVSIIRTGPNGSVRYARTTYTINVTRKQFNFMENQERTTKVGNPIEPVTVTNPDTEGLEIEVTNLPDGLIYNKEKNQIEGTPTTIGEYSINVKAWPKGTRYNETTVSVAIHVQPSKPRIQITNNNQTIQVGTSMQPSVVLPGDSVEIFGSDALLDTFSMSSDNYASEQGVTEGRISAFLKIFYGLNYDASTHTISGTPTRTGTITFAFIGRDSNGNARENFVLNVVESLSKIPVITEAQEGSNAIKGSGVAGATVTVTLPDGAVKTSEVAADGTWTVATTIPLVKGQSISARQKEVNKTESNDISATVVGNSGLVPSKEALVDAIVEGATTVTGKGENGSTITVTRPDGTVKTTTVSEGTWSVTLDTAAVKGENILVTQTEPNKATSPAVTATVVPKITKGDQGKPGETGPKGEQGEPGTPGAPGKDGFTPEISVTPNDDGSYTITITQPNGKEPIRTTVKNGTNGTNGRDGRTPKVKLTPIYEDPAHPRTRRTRSVDEDREAQPTGKQIGVHITVYFDNNNNGTYDEGDELISEENIYDGVDGIDGRDGINGTNGTDGVAGATGAAGRDGRDGKDILNGTENPGENQGKDGDTFVNTKTGDVFVKENGTWKPAGNIKGPKGDDGKDILNGKTDPTSEIGKDGDKYVNTETGDIFVKENGTWKSAGNIKGPKGDKGENGTNGTDGRDGTNGTNGTDGVAGATGAAGHDGRDGKDILNGTENPGENQGKDGDTFVNTKTGDVFVKENGTWKPAGNIKGPKGDDGKDILNGKTDPTSEIGKDGDKYVNTETGDIFVKENGTWKSAGNIKGPKGDKGENGTNGTDGRDGTNGTNGTDGVAGATGAAGHDGRDGKDILNGTENPGENQGKDGDTFVNTKTGDVFVKENGTWKPAGNIKGPKGDDGKDILNGKTDPTSEIGKDGDKYVNTETGDIFVKENGTWKSAGNIKGPKGDKGENGTNGTDGRDGTNGTNGTDGVAGATGAAGHDGRDGKDILNGTENPGENQGKDGDTFVNTKTGDVFVKENGTWKPAGNIKGPKGDDGKDILNGKTDPTSEIGKDGDKYVNTETGDIFVKENGTWKSAGNIKGPKGDKGENGTNGTDGRDGTNGTNGTDGVAGATGAAGHDGRDGKDGQSPTVTVRENTDGSHTIVITNPNGNTIETTVRDGKSPTVTVRENTDGTHTITIENADGKTTTTTVRDGKNGQSPTVSIRNNNDGTHTVTIINPDGSKTEAVIKDGKDGKDGQSPTVSVTNNGNGTHTIIITSSDGKVTTTVIKDGKCGCNNKPGGSTTPNPGAPTPGGSTTPNPGAPTPGGSTTPNPGAPTPGGSTTPNPGAPTPGGSTTPNPGEPTPGGVPGMPEPPVHELPEFPGITPNPNPGAPTPGGTPDRNPGEPTPGGTPDRNPGAPTPGGTPDRNPGEPTPGTTPNQPENPSEISITVNEHPNGELPKTGTTTDHLSILLGSGILLSLYVGKRKEEESQLKIGLKKFCLKYWKISKVEIQVF